MGLRMDAIWQRWNKVWHYLRWVLLAFTPLLVVWVLIYVPKMQVPVCPPGTDLLSPKDCFSIENEARKTLAYILGGLLAIIGIFLAYRRIRAVESQVSLMQKQVQVSQEGQITERFTRAINQLGDEKVEIRLGGIYALERIAQDSPKDYWTIIEIFTGYIRERAPWREAFCLSSKEKIKGRPNVKTTKVKPAIDIQAVLTVIGRRTYSFRKGEDIPLDLQGTDLRNANMAEANLNGAWFNGANLEGVNLVQTQLEGAEFWGVNLKKAGLVSSNLEGAILERANLEGADLSGANLFGVGFRKANLQGVDMRGVRLYKTNFEGAYLNGADLEGTDLRGAVSLTREQLADVSVDDKTILPDYLTSSEE